MDADADRCRWYMDDPNTFLDSEDSEDIVESHKNQRRSERMAVMSAITSVEYILL